MKGKREMKPSASITNLLYLLTALFLFVGSAFAAGEAVNLNIGALPAGKTITITYDVTVNRDLPLTQTSVNQQGKITGSNFSDVLTDDPDTPMANDATVTAIANIGPVAGFGSAVEFDGTDDYLQAVDGGNLNSTAYSIEAWVKLRTVRPAAIIFRTDATVSVYSNALYVNSDGNFVHYANDGNDHTVTGTTTAIASRWYHVAGVVDSSGAMRLYVNGVEEGSAVSGVGPLWTGGDRYLVGHDLFAAGLAYLDGWVDEVRIWNVGLTTEQISAWMYRGVDVSHASYANLAAYYRLDEAVGTTATDSAGIINGTLVNMTATPRVPSAVGELYTNEDTAAAGRFVVSDPDGTSTEGLNLAANLTFVVDSATLGSVSGISGNSFTFTPNANAFGDAAITYHVSDGSNDSAPFTTTVHIASVADTPSVSAAVTNVNTQTASGLVISRNPVDGAEVTHFKITNISGGTLFQNDGTTRIDNGVFITFAQGNAGLKFTPALDSTATGGFDVQASLSDSDAGPGGGTANAVITVNYPPAFIGSGTAITVSQDSGATDIKGHLHVIDIDSSQILAWSVSAAPDHGGSLNINGAVAQSGSADITPGGTITYQPAAGYTGNETFTVRVSDGIAAATRQITATVASPPTVSSISPAIGPAAGGTSVIVTGTNFTTAGAVKFGSANATNYTVVSDTQITATSPAGPAGTVDITVTTLGGTSATSAADQFTYVAPPTVTAVSPSNGPTVGGTSVTITGTNLTAATAVRFGGSSAAGYSVDSATQITATSPAGSEGTIDITVTTAGGTSATTSADQFTYIAAPAVTGVSPSSGPLAGGTSVTVTGARLTTSTAVKFGNANAAGYTVDSATQITATAPPGSAGTVDITVITVGGTSATSSADQFTYVPAPSVTGVSPSSGPSTGATSVTITGTNLTAATAVKFGSTNAVGYSVDSATQITATSPAGTAGTAHITITTAGGTSATTSAVQFTYIATVTGVAVGNGTISCASPVTNGASGTCTITPDPGYRLSALTAGSSDILSSITLDQVTIASVTADVTVTATFTEATYGGRAVTSGTSDAGAYATAYAADGTQRLVYERDGSIYYRSSSLVSGNWSAEETVAVGHDPAIALKQDGAPVIAFLSGGQIRTTTRGTDSWSAPADTDGTGANSVELAVDGSDHLHLAYTKVGSDGYDDILYTGNASGSWSSPATICHGSYSSGVWTFCRTPQLRADDGNYHIVYSKQQINSSLGEGDPQWMVYTTNGGGSDINSHNLNTGSSNGTAQLLAMGSFGYDSVNGYTLAYGNDMEAAGLWLATHLDGGTWSESAVAAAGALPVQGNDDIAHTRHLAWITPDGRLKHTSLTGAVYSGLTELAPSAVLPFVNPVKRSVLYRAVDANSVQQLYQVGIAALALLTPADGSFGNVMVGETAEKTFNLTNNGSGPLTVSGIATGNPGYTFEVGTDNCTGQPLNPGVSCAFTVKNSHQDIASGAVTDTLTITSDDPVRGTITLPLTMQVVEPYYPLALTINGSGTVTATAAGQSDFPCGSGTCSQDYNTGSVVTLTAAAPTGYTFTGFTFTADGSAFCGGTGCSVTINGETRVTATFSRNSYVISPLTTGNGTLTCPSPVLYGASDTCTVTPASGYRIEGVGGTCGGTLNGTTYTTLPVTASCTVEVVFVTATQRSVNVTVTGTGAGTVYSAPTGLACSLGLCSVLFDDATAATLTAVPDANSTFGGWSGACTNASGPCELTLTADKSVAAEFSAAPKVKVDGGGYATLSAAYAATTNGSVIKARSLTFTEGLILNGNRQVLLEGGFNAPYDCNTCGDNTLLNGTLTVEKGSVILENLTIR